jgi:predicted dehydrogenase
MSFEPFLDLDLRPRALIEMVPDLRIGMIGLGRVVQNNVLPAYLARGYSVVAGADPDADARDRTTRKGVPAVYADYREMLDAERPDVVDINLRWDQGMSRMRVEAVEDAASRGIHVLIAKPLAETYDQCLAIVAAAERHGITLAVNQNSRYAPTFFACRRLIEAGAIGGLVSASISWDAARGVQHDPGFNTLQDVTVHQTDILLSWFDEEPLEVFADQTVRTPVGSIVTAIMRFTGDRNATLRDDFISELRNSWPASLAGDAGSLDGLDDIEVPEPGQPRMARGALRLSRHERPGVNVQVPLRYRYAPESFASTMGDLLLAVRDGSEPWASGRNVLRTMRTLFAIAESARTHQPVVPASLAATASAPSAD